MRHRKKKAVHKTTTTDDKRLQNTLKRLGVNTIPGIEEVNIFQEDTVIHFSNPKGKGDLRDMLLPTHFSCTVQASIAANTYVVSGTSQTKSTWCQCTVLGHTATCCTDLQELLPGIINQLGPDNLSHLQKIAQQVRCWCFEDGCCPLPCAPQLQSEGVGDDDDGACTLLAR